MLRGDSPFRRLVPEPLEVAGVGRFAASPVVIKARFKTRPLRQWEVKREFNRRINDRFDELGIELPFPHQTVYFGADREGRASPAHVEIHHADTPAGERLRKMERAPAPPHLAPSSGD